MTPQERILMETMYATTAINSGIKYAAEAAEHAASHNMATSYLGKAMHKLRAAEAHLNRARAEEQKLHAKHKIIHPVPNENTSQHHHPSA